MINGEKFHDPQKTNQHKESKMDKCRVCCSTDALFQWDTVVCNDVTYEDVFYHCTQLERTNFSEFNKICSPCKSELEMIYKFVEKAKASFFKLKEAYSGENQDGVLEKFEVELLKIEDIDSNTYNEIEDCRQFSKDDLSKLDESIDSLDENVSIDEFCSEELLLETRGNPDSHQFDEESLDSKGLTDESSDNTCEYCGKCLKSKATKAYHIKLMHNFSTNVLCDKCPKTFKNKIALGKHRQIHHQNRERKYACKHCDKKFFTSSNCRSHEDTHLVKREKKRKCDQCDKSFYNTGALNVHKRMHTGQMEKCLLCEKRYPRLIDLQIHMRSHSNEKPFKCEKCENAFQYSSSLYVHMRKEHLGFNFTCYICAKQFKTSELLEQHKAQHDACFICAHCNTAFFKRHMLRRHLRGVHGITKEADLKELVDAAKQNP